MHAKSHLQAIEARTPSAMKEAHRLPDGHLTITIGCQGGYEGREVSVDIGAHLQRWMCLQNFSTKKF